MSEHIIPRQTHQQRNPASGDESLIDSVCDVVEKAWRSGSAPDLRECLPAGRESMHRDMLLQMILVDSWYRKKQGLTATLEKYLDTFPELQPLETLPAEFVAQVRSVDAGSGIKLLPGLRGQAADSGSSDPSGLAPTFLGSNAGDTDDSCLAPGQPKKNDAEPLPETIGRYRIEAELGRGGFGVVYKAWDEQLRRPVAIKVTLHPFLKSNSTDDYLTEARTVAGLDHPHIVPVYDVGLIADGNCYVVSKLIEGRDLASQIREKRPTHQAAVEIVASIAEALHYAHTKGFVHRDVKPANILIDTQGRAFLADFGISLSEEQLGKGAELAGTANYMSPEQARGGSHRVDGRSDVYNLGVVLYELLTGRRPFQNTNVVELLQLIADHDVRPLRQIDDTIPPELDRICLKALSRSLNERYSTAKDFAKDLRQSADVPLVLTTLPQPNAATAAPNPISNRTIAIVGVSTIVILFVGGIWLSGALSFPEPLPSGVNTASTVERIKPPTERGSLLKEFAMKGSRDRSPFQPIASLLPLQNGDHLRFSVQLNEPAYMRMFWINAAGEPMELYPTDPEAGYRGDLPVDNIQSPIEPDRGWPITVAGDHKNLSEVLIVVADSKPIPELINQPITDTNTLVDLSLPEFPANFGDSVEEYHSAIRLWIDRLNSRFDTVTAIGIPMAVIPLKADFRIYASRGKTAFQPIEDFQPLRNGDHVRFSATLNRPAYLQLIWIDSIGVPQEIFPNDPESGFQGNIAASKLESPVQLDHGWPLEGDAGIETAVLLISEKPLESLDLQAFRMELKSENQNTRFARFIATRTEAAVAEPGATRSLGTKSNAVDDAVLQLVERIRSTPGIEVVQVMTIPHRKPNQG